VSEPTSRQIGAANAHRLRRMSGRDPHEPHRVASPLELLASAGVSTPVCLLVVTAATTMVVASFELLGHQCTADAVARIAGSATGRS